MKMIFVVILAVLVTSILPLGSIDPAIGLAENPVQPASYIIDTAGSFYTMTNGTTFQVDYLSDNATRVFAFAYGNLTSGGKIFIKNGIYNLTGNVTPSNGTVTEGESWQAILAGETGCSTIFYLVGTPNGHFVDIQIKNLQLDGTRLASGKGVYADYVDNLLVEHCYVHDTPHTGIGPDFLTNFTIKDNLVVNCAKVLGGNGIGIGGPSSNGSIYGNSVSGTKKVGTYGHGIVLEELLTSGMITNVVVSNNVALSNDDSGFLGKGITNCTIIGNDFSSNSANGIYLYDWDSSFMGSHNVEIEANACHHNGDAGIRIRGTAPSSRDFSVTRNNVTYNRIGIITYVNETTITNNFINYNTEYGIYIIGVQANSITENNITTNGKEGINLVSSSNNSITENNMTANNNHGINLYYSSGNSITGNNIKNSSTGIALYSSPNNVLRSNMLSGNAYGFNVSGPSLLEFVQDIDLSNMVNGKPVCYWVNETDKTVPAGCGYVALANCTGITVQNLTLSKNCQGILLAYTINTTITKNNITDNDSGLWIDSSSNNSIVENIINANNGEAVYLVSSSNSSITENNITTNNGYGIYLVSSLGNSIARNNITTNNARGVCLVSSSNNSIIGNNIANSYHGIFLGSSSDYNSIAGNSITADNGHGMYVGSCAKNSITGNNITTNNYYGLWLSGSSSNSIAGNNITANEAHGIAFHYSSNNSIAENNVTANNHHGIYLFYSSVNIIARNSIVNSLTGLYLYSSLNNSIYHNKFINNTVQVQTVDSVNVWDDGYPSGGNYWSDYASKYPNATEIDSSGVWNTPYVIDTNNTDHYPVVPEFPSLFIIPMCILASFVVIIASRRKHLKAAGD